MRLRGPSVVTGDVLAVVITLYTVAIGFNITITLDTVAIDFNITTMLYSLGIGVSVIMILSSAICTKQVWYAGQLHQGSPGSAVG